MIFHFVLVVVRRTRDWSHFFTHFSFTVDMLDLHLKSKYRVDYRGRCHLVCDHLRRTSIIYLGYPSPLIVHLVLVAVRRKWDWSHFLTHL